MKRKDIIYGIRPIIEAIQADKTIDKVLIQRGIGGELMRELTRLIHQRNIPMQLVPIEKLHRMVNGNHQGAIAYVSEIDYASIFDVIPTIYETGEDPFILVLDRITDVRNLGAIVRTAECAGVHAVVIPAHNSAQINEDAVKTSAGAIHNVPICRHVNLKEVFVFLKEAGITIVGATEKAKKMHFDVDYCKPICIIWMVRQSYPQAEIIFANGGDRTSTNIPEMDSDDKNLYFAFGVGGTNKANSSSWILQEWKAPKTERQWGYYRVLHEAPGMKVKELTVNSGKSLSMQRHAKRREYWVVEEGNCKVETDTSTLLLETHQTIDIPVGSWHRLSNPFTNPCRIVEIQYGEQCIEEDIERK